MNDITARIESAIHRYAKFEESKHPRGNEHNSGQFSERKEESAAAAHAHSIVNNGEQAEYHQKTAETHSGAAHESANAGDSGHSGAANTLIHIDGRTLNDFQSTAFRGVSFQDISGGSEKQNAWAEQIRHERWLSLATRLSLADTVEKANEYATKVSTYLNSKLDAKFWIDSRNLSDKEIIGKLASSSRVSDASD